MPANKIQRKDPLLISGKEHGIDQAHINRHAIKIIQRLAKAGHQAQIVGGAVRDLLLGKVPKDFDIATSATPEEVRALFRNSRIIGRRFRLVHVYFGGHDIIEVSTYRAQHEENSQDGITVDGQIVRDNVYGTMVDDAYRRDFTINALFYNPLDDVITDYLHGLKDLDKKILRIIGDPAIRFQEDPVRILRALRFAAKLDLQIHAQTACQIEPYAKRLENISPSRLFDEMVKILRTGKSMETFRLLQDYKIFELLFPQTHTALSTSNNSTHDKFIFAALSNTDHRIQNDQGITPAFSIAVLLWPALQRSIHNHSMADKKITPFQAHHLAMQEVLKKQQKITSVPRVLGNMIRDIWVLQLRLPSQRGKRPYRVLAHPRFRAAYDFLELRLKSGETELKDLYQWWTTFQYADSSEQNKMTSSKTSGNKANTPS